MLGYPVHCLSVTSRPSPATSLSMRSTQRILDLGAPPGAWDRSSARKPAYLNVGETAHVQDRGLACGSDKANEQYSDRKSRWNCLRISIHRCHMSPARPRRGAGYLGTWSVEHRKQGREVGERDETRVARQISVHAHDGASFGQETRSWIGNAVPDSLVTPERHNLSSPYTDTQPRCCRSSLHRPTPRDLRPSQAARRAL